MVSFTTGALEYIAPSATDTAVGHYMADRIDMNEMMDYGSEYGYQNTFMLWQLKGGSWTDVDPNQSVPTPTPVPDECEAITTYNYKHKSDGRATSSGSFWSPTYTANGSGYVMPGSSYSQNTLRSEDGSYWELGDC